ncbi:MAG: periplasmic heavy metal sensor [Candidatus Binatia bacterium]
MRSHLVILPALAILLLAARGVVAQIPPLVTPPPIGSAPIPSSPPTDESPGIMMSLLLRGAGLSAEQSERVKRIFAQHRGPLQSLRRQLRAAQDGLADRMTAPGDIKIGDLGPQLDRVAKLRRDLAEEMTRAALEVRAILTPEQLQRAAKWKDRMRAVEGELRSLVGDEEQP